jgi:hypothetical protein
MRWRGAPKIRSKSKNVVDKIVTQYSKKATRTKQPMQVYAKRYYENMKQEVDEEVEAGRPPGPDKELPGELKQRWFKAYHRVVKEHWENEDVVLKQSIIDEVEKERVERGDEASDDDDPSNDLEGRSPEEYAE